ncbi:hypothetical protein BC831DRAFT_24318 [Entophlyctis helioformis]|nr:hypothetical protein BC831DRAFT_24318 [Entophlyctis helioformis]
MPGIELFGRRCHVASDDLFLPALQGFLLHAAWTSLAIYLLVHLPWDCSQHQWQLVYLVLVIIVFVLEAAHGLAICWLSLRGSVADDRPRRPVIKVIYSLIGLNTIEAVLHSFALAMYYEDTQPCTDRSAYMNLFMFAVHLYLAALCGFAVLLVLQLAAGGKASTGMDRIDNPRFWEFCLAPLVCFPLYIRNDGRRAQAARALQGGSGGTMSSASRGPNGGRGTILGDVAQLLAELMGDVDLVASDVLVGIMLVREKQRRATRSRAQSNAPIEYYDRTAQDLPFHRDLKNICHFMDYAEAIYGFPLYMFANFSDGLKHLLCPCTSPAPMSSIQAVRTYMDRGWSVGCLCCFPASCFFSNPREHEDLVYASTVNRLFKSPFVVCLDHEFKAIVISIRGTLSTTDLLVDLHFGLSDIDIPHASQGSVPAQTHSGMLRTARNIIAEIEYANVLQQLLLSSNSPYASTYKVVVTGHSLGGGVAALVAFLLKTSHRYAAIADRVFCIAYSSPGCAVTAEGQEYFKTFCTTVVLDKDLVPRLTPYTVHALKEEVKAVLQQCHSRRKVDIIGSAMMRQFVKKARKWLGLPPSNPLNSSMGDPLATEEQQQHLSPTFMQGDEQRMLIRQSGESSSSSEQPQTHRGSSLHEQTNAAGSRGTLPTHVTGLARSRPTSRASLRDSLDTASIGYAPHAQLPTLAPHVPLAPANTYLPGHILHIRRVVASQDPMSRQGSLEDMTADNQSTVSSSGSAGSTAGLIAGSASRASIRSAGRAAAASNGSRSRAAFGGFGRFGGSQASSQPASTKPEFEVVWAQPESFHSIVISSFMGIDHFPNRIAETLAVVRDAAE